MNLKQETREPHTIQSYHEHSITVQGINYDASVLITPTEIVFPWTLNFETLLNYQPEIILLGFTQPPELPIQSLAHLTQHRIGFESMPLGPACRTFNLLLQEGRHVILGVLMSPF